MTCRIENAYLLRNKILLMQNTHNPSIPYLSSHQATNTTNKICQPIFASVQARIYFCSALSFQAIPVPQAAEFLSAMRTFPIIMQLPSSNLVVAKELKSPRLEPVLPDLFARISQHYPVSVELYGGQHRHRDSTTCHST
jgi:hypothetical protein